MKIATQVFAFTGMMVAGAAMLSTAHAASFGQQWRPASTGYATTHNNTYGNGFRRVANVPSFRPRTSASSPRYVARSSYRPAAAYPRPIRPHQAAYPQVTHMPRPQGMTHPGMSPWAAMPGFTLSVRT